MARRPQLNGTAKWIAVILTSVAVVGGAAWHVATARAQVTQNTQRIDRLEAAVAALAEIKVVLAKIATRLEVETELSRKEKP